MLLALLGGIVTTAMAVDLPSAYALERRDQKSRGAFFTPPDIAQFLSRWAIAGNPEARVLDPTCGEAAFLLASSDELLAAGADGDDLIQQLFGLDIHEHSVARAHSLLSASGRRARLFTGDFFSEPSPDRLDSRLPLMDAVVGNPPFIRYQMHRGEQRARSLSAALRQGVRLSGLASSWAATLVHASSFLRPDGRLAMVVPAELLTVHYAEPIRRWLRRRFADVSLVMVEQLQFEGALERVVLLLARGTGGCDAFMLHHVADGDELATIGPFEPSAVSPAADGKWTDLLLPPEHRSLFRRVVDESFTTLRAYGAPELGAVTGANNYFAITEETRQRFDIAEEHVVPISPPGTKHLRSSAPSAKG